MSCDKIYLLINTTSREQFKVLLEHKSTEFVFPSDSRGSVASSKSEADNGWEVVNQTAQETPAESSDQTPSSSTSEDLTKIIPAAKARLMSLKELGAKKIGSIKMKFSDNRSKVAKEKEKIDEGSRFMISCIPEPLTTPTGPFFSLQTLQNKNVMGAIHSYTSTLLVSLN